MGEYTLSKLSKKCEGCLHKDTCDSKEMEMCALAKLPPKVSADATGTYIESAAMPLMRERIKSPPSPFAYKDELEKALSEHNFGQNFMFHART